MEDSTKFRGNVHYTYKETLQTMYPDLEVEVKYAGQAYVDGNEATLLEPISIAIGDGVYKNYPVPTGSTIADWKTISHLKEAALKTVWQQVNGLEFSPTMDEMLGRFDKGFIE